MTTTQQMAGCHNTIVLGIVTSDDDLHTKNKGNRNQNQTISCLFTTKNDWCLRVIYLGEFRFDKHSISHKSICPGMCACVLCLVIREFVNI